MGLFDVVRNIGGKLFAPSASPEDAASKIRGEIEAAHLGIQNLGGWAATRGLRPGGRVVPPPTGRSPGTRSSSRPSC